MKVDSFYCGGEWTDFAFFGAQHPRAGTRVYIPYFAFLFRSGERHLLFETGPNAHLVDNPAAWIGQSAELYEVEVDESQLLVNQLREIGVSPDQITDVVVSHLHYDHAGSITSFPAATIHVQRAEYDAASHADPAAGTDYVRAEIDGAVRWNFLDGDADLCGDGTCLVLSTPGHTPGHQSLIVQVESGVAIFVGDAAPYPATLADRVLPSVVWNAGLEFASWQRIAEAAVQHSAALVFPHDPSFRQTMDFFAPTQTA